MLVTVSPKLQEAGGSWQIPVTIQTVLRVQTKSCLSLYLIFAVVFLHYPKE
jgi:hypothetical protein